MPQTNLFTINKISAPATCNLQSYPSTQMTCPVLGQAQISYFIPLAQINSFSHNPARSSGTSPQAVVMLLDDLITDQAGQLEPICIEWNPATGKFDIVFGCHREWATNDAYAKGYQIANHPITGVPGIWAWIFTGSDAQRTALQLRENGNKKPSSPATKTEVVNLLRRYISQGGLDNAQSAFVNLSTKAKYNRARTFMKNCVPFWGGRKFKGVWNALTLNGASSIGVSFTTFGKPKLAEYFCSNNSYGIAEKDLCDKLSGSVVKKGGKTYGIYFVNNSAEAGGALPTNASKLRFNNKIDHMIIVASMNDSTTATVARKRNTFEKSLSSWNTNIFDAFDEVFWMPQTQSEHQTHILKGTWVAQNKL